MKSTRDHLLEYLRKTKGATTEEMASFLGLATATVRRHLEILQRDSVVTFHIVRRKTGRPHYRYCLTDQGRDSFAKNYHRILSGLCQEIRSLKAEDVNGCDGSGVLGLALERLGSRSAAVYRSRLGNHSLESRIEELVKLLNDDGFLAEWRPNGSGHEIVNFHCPYFHVAWDHNLVCTLDARLLQQSLGLPVTHVESLARGAERCLFHIDAPPPDGRGGAS